ncbi:MAG: hypothetical protein ABJJ44_07255 [Paraglaciecola sp.]|uniref:hypothetical protein n=1 Tax=Paraglaciecola sp. TaxID=1920173 RepID=UPI003297E37A
MFYQLVRKLLYALCLKINKPHWFLLCQPSIWFSKNVVVVGTGSLGKNVIAALINTNKNIYIIDDKAARYAYSILQIAVLPWTELGKVNCFRCSNTRFILTMYEGVDNARERLHKLNVTQGIVSFSKEMRHNGQVAIQKRYVSQLKVQRLNEIPLCLPTIFSNSTLLVEHNLGGGTYHFSKRHIQSNLHNSIVLVLTYCDDSFHLSESKSPALIASFYSLDMLIESLKSIKFNELFLSNLFGFNAPLMVLQRLLELEYEAITSFIHDYFAICQSYTLWNEKNEYCHLPSPDICNRCIRQNRNINDPSLSIETWRSTWLDVLLKSDQVITFSSDSHLKMKQTFPQLNNLIVIPHSLDYFQPSHVYQQKCDTNSVLNIGILGPVTAKKGELAIKKLHEYIVKNDLNTKLIIIGRASSAISELKHVTVTGPYEIANLGRVCANLEISVFFFASLCPETFSFSVSEIILMKYPILCFDLGAQADKVKEYGNGIVIPLHSSGETMIVALQKAAGYGKIHEK